MGWRSNQLFGVFQVPQPRLPRFPDDSRGQRDILGVSPCRSESKSPKTLPHGSLPPFPLLRDHTGSPNQGTEGFILETDPHGAGLEQHLHPCLTFHSLHFLTNDSKENRAAPWYSMEICSKLVKTPPTPFSCRGQDLCSSFQSPRAITPI